VDAKEDLMSESPHGTCYPDHVWQGQVVICENVPLARDTYRLRFACPQIARRILPGQFLMLRFPGCNDPLLGRPLALYDVGCDGQGDAALVDIVYMAIGRMTRLLAVREPGSRLEIWGPLGNGFAPQPAEHLVMVAGGIGQTPFLSLAKEYTGRQTYGDPARVAPRAKRVTLCFGARSQEHLACVDDFRNAGVDVRLSTDDGSQGHHGLVTELIRPLVQQSPWPCRIVCCGPEPMLRATARLAAQLDLPCQVSLESPMACGIGICFSCVVPIREASGGWDYRRTCVDGPVFDAAEVKFPDDAE
jgi:dihydroorotate dehydrogenase electron transfer subunit